MNEAGEFWNKIRLRVLGDAVLEGKSYNTIIAESVSLFGAPLSKTDLLNVLRGEYTALLEAAISAEDFEKVSIIVFEKQQDQPANLPPPGQRPTHRSWSRLKANPAEAPPEATARIFTKKEP